MPFFTTCQTCSKEFVAQKRAAKYCTMSCAAKARIPLTIARNKARRKYAPVEGLSKCQASYRGRNGVDRLRDVKKRHNLLLALGGKCVKCGYGADLRGLVLDHIHGDGYEDRKKLGAKIFRYYVNNLNEAAQKLQVLCATCNQIKSFENKEHNRSRRVLERNI